MAKTITMPCQWCDDDDDDTPEPTVLDIDGILSTLSGKPGCWGHAWEGNWWPCQRKACEEHAELKRLRAICNDRVGGERRGDTLIRLAELICCVGKDPSQPDTSTADWKDWLRDFARQLNAAAGEEPNKEGD